MEGKGVVRVKYLIRNYLTENEQQRNITKSIHITVNRLNNKTHHFILASFFNAKKKKKAYGLVIKVTVNCLAHHTYYC